MLRETAHRFSSLDFFARETVEGFITGMHKSPFHGFSVEFAEHRAYNQGDSIRNIDWKLFARTDNLFVKRFEEETNLRSHLILDTSASMHYPSGLNNKLEFALKSAAVLSYLLKKQRDAFGLTCFSDKINYQSAIRSSTGHYQEVITRLEGERNIASQSTQTDIVSMLHLIAEKIHRRSLVILFSDLFDSAIFEDAHALFDAFNHLKFKKHEVIVFHIVSGKEEIQFSFPSGPHKFVDKETGEELKINTDEVRDDYISRIKSFNQVVKTKSLQYGIDYIEADIDKGFEQILLPFLLKRQKLN
ncbi:MAG: DUF58 domain-containing protein [Bacteroidia bacterium]|nr:DUF58 domain-containing protein [Bacteroidia bacterium]MCO5254678.1 DUF58 domain-containing protein [Bacteroidota bacterium]MCZ2130406.1 DUF58 domain-containing protein [Bacteroidia bacterium]